MKIDTIKTESSTLSQLSNINIILGRNGSGKSKFLREIDTGLSQDSKYNISYISPERAGVFRKQGHIDTNIENDPNWLRSSRSVNQAADFKTTSASLLREVELLYLRRLERTPDLRKDEERNFKNDVLDKINALLSNISINGEHSGFNFKTHTGEVVLPEDISSGESEVVALATEVLYFFEKVDFEKFNLLLIDEPDVHLHPDLQARFATFLINEIKGLADEEKDKVAICVATHSTPFICALAVESFTLVANKEFGNNVVTLKPISEHLKKIAPFFGHPLSLTFNNDPLLILEGKDDERVWQQAARTAQGKIKLFPVLATSVDQQGVLENFCSKILPSIYDNPLAYSLRDGDSIKESLPPVGCVIRFRLNCYAVENLLLSDECLSALNSTWENFKEKASEWIKANENHKDVAEIRNLISSEDRLQDTKIKDIRTLICSICKSNKPWEVVVGQTIGQLKTSSANKYSLYSMIGTEACEHLLGIKNPDAVTESTLVTASVVKERTKKLPRK